MQDDSSVVASRKSSAGHDESFDAIKHVDEHGEWWSARELQPLMGYDQWRRFDDAIERAKAACANAGVDVTSNFASIGKVSGTRGPNQADYRLTRYGAYLIAMNGDPRKSEVAAAQTYFAIRAREAEVAEAEHDELPVWAQQQIATIRRVGKLEVEQQMQRDRITAVEAKVDQFQGRHDWYTALAYCRLKELSTSMPFTKGWARSRHRCAGSRGLSR